MEAFKALAIKGRWPQKKNPLKGGNLFIARVIIRDFHSLLPSGTTQFTVKINIFSKWSDNSWKEGEEYWICFHTRKTGRKSSCWSYRTRITVHFSLIEIFKSIYFLACISCLTNCSSLNIRKKVQPIKRVRSIPYTGYISKGSKILM